MEFRINATTFRFTSMQCVIYIPIDLDNFPAYEFDIFIGILGVLHKAVISTMTNLYEFYVCGNCTPMRMVKAFHI